MTNIFIIHGLYGYPEEGWFPWLKEELENLGHKVFVPQFPTKQNQNLIGWLKEFKRYKKELTKDSIIVGHSLGVPFSLNVLEKYPVKAAFFVAGCAGLLNNPILDPLIRTFVNKIFDWKKIKKNCKKFYIFHSDNDNYVPYEKAEELSKFLETDITFVKNAGHFNKKSGYTKFDLLLDKIKKEL